MYPLEMKFDKNNIGYIDINNIILERKQFINQDYDSKEIIPVKKDFYLTNSKDYLLKINKNIDEHDAGLHELTIHLIKKQYEFRNIDLPIGIVFNELDTVGQIIRYYKNAKSLKNICINEDLESLQKYIYRDEDSLHNLFLVYLEVLDILEEMFESGISYFDVNGGNFVIYNNKVKIIDFEPEYISFKKMKYDEHIIIHNYLETLGQLIRALGINEYYDCVIGDKEFSKIRTKVKQFENKIRRYR